MYGNSSISLYFVTNNKHKYEEASRVLSKYGIKLELLPSVKKIEIQDDDLSKIVLYAAKTAYAYVRKPLVVEDAGLFIKALKGFPGPYSSYVYKTIGIKGVLKLLENTPDRQAYFKSVVACVCPPYIEVFEGVVEGWIAREPRGSKGFGFDPIFVPQGSDKTFAEMDMDEKNKYSHRGKAFESLAEFLKKLKGFNISQF